MAISGGDGSIILKTSVDTSGLSKGLKNINSIVKNTAKGMLLIGGAISAVTGLAVKSYADYEQLVGGVETLFKDSAEKVKKYAEDAFLTAGLSKNEYMERVTSFSASLIRSTAGDTEKAADIANMALIDISDNVNKMGSSMESVTLAYQGFAKQQYQLLDNLKLGYGGTKTEMERLLKDAQALTGVKYDINNLADVYSAIHAIQENMGIAGTTAKEAEKTISGSAKMMKASWKDLLTAMAGGGDLDRAINNFVYSLEKFTSNIAPVIERTMLGLGQAIQRTLPMLVQTVVKALVQQIPNLVMAVYNMIIGLFKGIVLGIKELFTGETSDAMANISQGTSDANKNIEDMVGSTEDLEKQANKATVAFDELIVLSSGSDETETNMPNIDSGDIGTGDIGTGGHQQTSNDGLSGMVKEIKANLEYLLSTIELALVAIGLILLATGNIAWGIGFIIAGAYLYSVSERSDGSFDFGVVMGDFQSLVDNIEKWLIGIGIVLLFFGQIGWGIGFIIAGTVAYAVKELQTGEFDTADITTKLAVIMEYVSIAMIGIGILLIFFGQVALGLGFIFAGKHLLAVQEQQLSESGVTTKVQQFIDENASLIVGVGLALVVIGIICFCFGIFNPITFGIFMAGASVLATAETMNPGSIKDVITSFFQENAEIITGLAIALLVLGVLLLFTKSGIGIGITLIIASVSTMVIGTYLDPSYLGDTLLPMLQKITNVIATFSVVIGIILLFTGAWPQGLGLIVGGAIGFFGASQMELDSSEFASQMQNELNNINDVAVEGVNNINGTLAGINLPSNYGGSSGSYVLGRGYNIPHLARGAVIPPNREFLAVLGDQKSGTNIEAPLDTIKQAFRDELNNMGSMQSETVTNINFTGNLAQLARVLKPQIERETLRQGTKMITGGAY